MQLGPEMSEAQRINAKMMRFMPFMFLVFLYFFSSALVLYWTVQNIMTILQTLLTKSMPPLPDSFDDEKSKKALDRKNSKRLEGFNEVDHEDSEMVRKFRNLLGLKVKGKIDLNLLESRYKERMKNYSSNRLSSMSESKRASAEHKREKITEAYEFLKEEIDKES